MTCSQTCLLTSWGQCHLLHFFTRKNLFCCCAWTWPPHQLVRRKRGGGSSLSWRCCIFAFRCGSGNNLVMGLMQHSAVSRCYATQSTQWSWHVFNPAHIYNFLKTFYFCATARITHAYTYRYYKSNLHVHLLHDLRRAPTGVASAPGAQGVELTREKKRAPGIYWMRMRVYTVLFTV